jgi:hypothetical protein
MEFGNEMGAHGFASPPYDGFAFIEDEEVSPSIVPRRRELLGSRRRGHPLTFCIKP